MDDIKIVAPKADRDLDAVIDLASKTFGNYWSFRRECRDGYIVGAPYDWATSRIGLIGSQVVTHFGVWDFTMRVGVSRLRVAGIGAVATHDDYRKRGFMRRTVEECLAAQRLAGYDLTLLFGIQHFYDKFGYRRVFTDQTITVGRRDLPKMAANHPGTESFRELEISPEAIAGRLAERSNREYETTTGTFVRPSFTTNRKPHHWHGLEWVGTAGESGYVIYDASSRMLKLVDCAGDAGSVLAALAEAVEANRCDGVQFTGVPARSRLGLALRRGDASFEGRYVQDGGAMAAVVDAQSTFEKLSPELSRRLEESGFASWTGVLALEVGAGNRISLGVDNGRVAVVPDRETEAVITAGADVVRLITGGEHPEALLRSGAISATESARPLVKSLFPCVDPGLLPWDHF